MRDHTPCSGPALQKYFAKNEFDTFLRTDYSIIHIQIEDFSRRYKHKLIDMVMPIRMRSAGKRFGQDATQKGNTMKKLVAYIMLMLIFSSGVLAQDKSLYEISTQSIEITQHVMHCINGDAHYTDKDLLMLKNCAKNTLQDLIRLVRSRDTLKMTISQEQAAELKIKATTIYKNLIKLKGTDCNELANEFFVWGYLIFLLGLVLTLSIGGAIYGIPLIIVSLIVVLFGVIAFILCSLAL